MTFGAPMTVRLVYVNRIEDKKGISYIECSEQGLYLSALLNGYSELIDTTDLLYFQVKKDD